MRVTRRRGEAEMLRMVEEAHQAAAHDPRDPAHPWIERDPGTGTKILKMPFPPPDGLRGRAA